MDLQVAIQLIDGGVEHNEKKQVWADLGAGSGTFTIALSKLLPAHSLIYAIDNSTRDLNSITIDPSIELQKIQGDFVQDEFDMKPLTGVLMANSLHFVKEKELFLKRLKQNLIAEGRLLIVEYELEQANPWVPFPVGYKVLRNLALQSGFTAIKKLYEVPSMFDNRMLYSVLVT